MSAPPGPPPPWPPYYPPPARPERQWLPVAIIVAAIIVATAVIAAVLLNRGPGVAAPSSADPTTASGSTAAAATSSTCRAWPSTSAALNQIPGLPAGWDWSTPDIDIYISNQSAAVNKALDLFQADVAATDPPEVISVANDYISERRKSMRMLVERTYTGADGVPGNIALAKLNDLCGED